MNIQKTNSPSFGAMRITTISNKKNVIDVFKLDSRNINDLNFIKRCKDTLEINKSKGPKTKMKTFFDNFLKSSSLNTDGDYFIGIKNGETISGGLYTYSFSNNIFSNSLFHQNFTNTKDKLAKDSLLYGMFSDTLKNLNDNPGVYVLGPNSIDEIKSGYIDKIKNHIETQHPDCVFKEVDEPETDLEELLGIDDIETKRLL